MNIHLEKNLHSFKRFDALIVKHLKDVVSFLKIKKNNTQIIINIKLKIKTNKIIYILTLHILIKEILKIKITSHHLPIFNF